MQATIRTDVSFTGVGLHTGRLVRMTIRPRAANMGLWFRRIDLPGAPFIPARYDRVPESRLCTRLDGDSGASVSTVEHVMAALAGCGIHNALVELDGPEVPILDGSAAPFVRGILDAGIQRQDAPIHAIAVLREITVTEGEASASLSPAEGLEMDFAIDFADAAIGRQRRVANLANGRFVREYCDSRTFCRQADVDAMRAAGLALGGTYDNAVVVDGADVLSPGGFRHADEAVRHKMLDALGDLALAGAPLLARYSGVRAGHMLTNRLLRRLFATPGAVRFVECNAQQAAGLPGVGVNAGDLAHVA
ncbi:UDP-3-O-acyl-N-acetylglucosamine deacetylase [Roseibacterium sp. SDUM158017]|uniref:UDP-3-O-acyl-N-acetylglucosamine deacetylase n=1 Tax=Roseicyclus salinarum TaxID=3036773 RepID=UPI0024151640|nr:UDP-3-O-acyl-N-acetylglucosamine deacetylase [Roseibacterium sp. SDUM158017]MDG4647679.1 UDP-3-O-acyl-N-acetylglucosamine deacetylase [Roseibacterium sp. SDUM158017]